MWPRARRARRVSARPRVSAVSTVPGATALTRRPSGATSRAAACVSSRTAPLEASYAVIGPVEAVNADVEHTMTMLPRPRGAIARTAAWTTKKTPRTLTAINPSYADGSTSVSGCANAIPAAATTVPSGVSASTAATTSRIRATSVTSSSTERAEPPAARSAAAHDSPAAPSTSATTTSSPRRARASRDRPADAVGAPDDEAAAGRLSGCRRHR